MVVCPTQQSALVETKGEAGPADPDVDIREAVAWAVASGTLMALIAVFTAWQVVAFVVKAQKKNAGTGIVHGALAEE